ncbi:MAG: alpha/beta hydrolase-fold protein [Leptospirales bacterium]
MQKFIFHPGLVIISTLLFFSQSCTGSIKSHNASCLSKNNAGVVPCGTSFVRLASSSNSSSLENLEAEDSFALLPPDFDIKRAEKYPVLITLPYTGGGGADFIRSYLYNAWPYADKGKFEWSKAHRYFTKTHFEKNNTRFIILIPPGSGAKRDHDWTGFMASIDRYERRIAENLALLKQNYNADTSRVVLSGYSLGGDISWALALKYPGRYFGAIIMGTRIGYRNRKAYNILKKTGFRFYIGMGEFELEHRKKGNSEGRKILDQHKISYIYKTIPAGGHTTLKHSEFIDALYYTFRFQ